MANQSIDARPTPGSVAAALGACQSVYITHAHVLQVEFEKPVDAKGNIEVWLQRLVDGMQDTVKQVRWRKQAG